MTTLYCESCLESRPAERLRPLFVHVQRTLKCPHCMREYDQPSSSSGWTPQAQAHPSATPPNGANQRNRLA